MGEDIVDRLRQWVDRETIESDPAGAITAAADEIERLREAIRRMADQDATLAVVGGTVTVTMDATLTDAEREAIEWAVWEGPIRSTTEGAEERAATLRSLLERTK